MARYANGQPIRLSTTVTDLTGTLIDAGALTLTVQKPDATTQAYGSPTHDGTGLYHQDVPATDLTQTGHYQYKWVSTGNGAGVSVGDFDVFDPFEPAVLPLQDAKDALNIPQTNTTSDAEINAMIATIEANLEMIAGGPLYTRTVVERVTALQGWTTITLRARPVVAVQSIVDTATGTAVSIADLDVDKVTGICRRALGLPFFSRGSYYTVTYTAGWGTALPPAFNVAARIILQHLWKTQRGPQFRPDIGEETVLAGMSFAIPNRAAELLRPYAQEAYV